MKNIKLFFGIACLVFLFFPFLNVQAAESSLEISGWVPYWRAATGTAEVIKHIDSLDEVNLFAYSVKKDGSLFDNNMNVGKNPWLNLIKTAKKNDVKIIPSIMWNDGDAIHSTLSDSKLRTKNIKAILKMVKENKFDGVDIDYENKKAETNKFFSEFLKELSSALGSKILSCTIESRTPPDSLYSVIPDNIEYANDYDAINKYCDEVKIMTYDQGRADIKLNVEANGPYIPIADVNWVEKVVKLAEEKISKGKISIGVATYGYEYTLTKNSNGSYNYNKISNFNPRYATDIAKQFNITPIRNNAGELSFAYISTSTPSAVSLLWWSDAAAIKEKIDLAKKLGVKGVAVFKIDGGADSKLWDILK